jgi:L-rhamnose isomerase / sugar isomerase
MQLKSIETCGTVRAATVSGGPTPPGPPDTLDPATLQIGRTPDPARAGEEASMTVTAPERSTIEATLRTQRIELPSWAFGNSGTRFKVFAQAGVPRDPYEKIADAAEVHRYTGVAPTVALHIPWDKVDDYKQLADHAQSLGVALGTINSNTFQDNDYMLGSVCHPDARVRRKAVDHLLECIDIMDATGSQDLKLWFADGTNYPGQDDIRGRQDRLAESLRIVYERLGPSQRMVLEYKLFEPSFYTTDVPDWGTSLVQCIALGPKAKVVIDTGHHAPGTNIEFIVASLLRLDRLGGFDFNSRFYADDDLMVGAADPFQLFRIMHECVKGGALDADSGVAFMLDQCHNIEPKIPAQIRSVMNVQEATAKALQVDQPALEAAQASGDVLSANAILMDAYDSDVRPLLAGIRERMHLDPDPVAAFGRSGYAERIARERVGGAQAGWGA